MLGLCYDGYVRFVAVLTSIFTSVGPGIRDSVHGRHGRRFEITV